MKSDLSSEQPASYQTYLQEVDRLLKTPLQETPECVDDILLLEEPLEELLKKICENLSEMKSGQTEYILNNSIPDEEFSHNLFYHRYNNFIEFGYCNENRYQKLPGCSFGVYIEVNNKVRLLKKGGKSYKINIYEYSDGKLNNYHTAKAFLKSVSKAIVSRSPSRRKYTEFLNLLFRFPQIIAKSRQLDTKTDIEKETKELMDGLKGIVLED